MYTDEMRKHKVRGCPELETGLTIITDEKNGEVT